MIRQTCQKCGQTCTTDGYIVGIGCDEVGCSLYIGEWSRDWALCDGCARALQRYIAGFFEPVGTKASSAPLPSIYANVPDSQVLRCSECGLPVKGCICGDSSCG